MTLGRSRRPLLDRVGRTLHREAEAFRRVGIGHYLLGQYQVWQYRIRRALADTTVPDQRWRALEGIYAGQRAFLVGNGPSLNRTPLYLLRGEATMCFNRFHLMLERLSWEPTFTVVVDNLVLSDMVADLPMVAAHTGTLYLPDIHQRGERFDRVVPKLPNLYWLHHYPTGSGFSTMLPNVYGGGSVIYEGMQILRFLGFREIVLVGVDMSFQTLSEVNAVRADKQGIEPLHDSDPNHFDPRYFGRGRRHHQPDQRIVASMVRRLEFVASVAHDLGLTITNAGYGSKLECFPKKDLLEVLGRTPAEVDAAFDECVRARTRFGGLLEMRGQVRFAGPDGPDLSGDFILSATDGASQIPKFIGTHLPMGPHEGLLYFLRRHP